MSVLLVIAGLFYGGATLNSHNVEAGLYAVASAMCFCGAAWAIAAHV